ncbi:pentachlorophenol monooxygenase [Brachionus plicatilis]|uniref:Pentachlorophenol monooxygenase n=1 Tax=Brachionus plicatilis TaxID=10195 RepID=A0A3M7QR90_BRAPC|nr:pentachlorophenol monooxygenase [Brachionus plicatilis]
MKDLNDKKILIVGAGPVGLAAALFLSHKGTKPLIVDKLTEPNKNSKALGVNPRTLELMDRIGAVDEFIKNSFRVEHANFYHNNSLLLINNFQGVKHKYPYMIVQPQYVSEMVLCDLLKQRDIQVIRGTLVKNISTSNHLVQCELQYSNGKSEIHAFDYVFCADGAHSTTRKLLGLKFEGSSYEEPWFLFDVKLKSELKPNDLSLFLNKKSFIFLVRTGADIWRVISNDPNILNRLPGGSEVENIVWRSNFTISHRLIERFSYGSVFFGGDAAHVHSPAGGRGMNLGIEDAYVFAELFASNKLDQYDKLRRNVVKKTISRIQFFTNIVRGSTYFYRFYRWLGILIIPFIFPLIQNKLNYFLFGLDHEIF